MNFENISKLNVRAGTPLYSRSSNLLDKNYTNIICEFLADKYEYGAIFIDENYELIEAAGNYKDFISLPARRLHFNILKMLPEELSIALGTTLRRAAKDNEKATMLGIKASYSGQIRTVNIDVKPFLKEINIKENSF
ncbi:MAG TPA: hypothetical protein VF691_11190 [Cytophagaceae bacterium]|jgi:two-component system CheB/CheR fusion protein